MDHELHSAWIARARRFEIAAHEILGKHEDSEASRVFILETVYDRLAVLNLRQDDMLKQALRCAENGLYRAAHVMAWAACMDYIEEKLSADGLAALRSAHPKWVGRDMHEIAESVPEFQLVESLEAVGLSSKSEKNALIGLLRRRNECAHPTGYLPRINETLGYIDEVLQRIQRLAPRSLI